MNDLREGFFQECDELLEGLADGLNALDEGSGDKETINAMFRSVHSIKGGAGAFKLDQLVSFAHAFENVLDDVRSGKTAADAEVVALLFTASDHLTDLVEAARDGSDLEPEKGAEVLGDLKRLSGGDEDDDGGAMTAEELAVAAEFQPVTLDFGMDVGSDSGDLPGNIPGDIPGDLPGADLGGIPGLDGLPGLPGLDDAGGDAGGSFEIAFHAHREMFETGNEPVLLFRALGELGDLRVDVDDSAVTPLADFDWSEPVLRWTLRLEAGPDVDEDRVREVFEFVEGVCDCEITRLAAGAVATGAPPGDLAGLSGLAEPLPGLDTVMPAPGGFGGGSGGGLGAVGSSAGPASAGVAGGDKTPETGGGKPDAPASGAAKAGGNGANAAAQGKGSTIRVELQRVDRLINLVGELVISEAMLSQSMSELPVSTSSTIDNAMSQLKQLSGILQESVMAIRAQPVRGLFQRMSRIVRESARQAGKNAKLVTHGDATEVDKTVTERLVEPLTHMIRNAVDHGLEDANTRRARGKSERGTVTLSAAHRSGRVVITLSDDGGGIDRARVRAKAEEKGLINPLDELTEADIDNLLFLPGFSTAGEISNLSGRGVGMDVVRSEIQALGGRVTLASTPGEGTTVTISLPLTLAVLEGMIVQTSGQTVVVPTTALRETVLASEAAVHDFMNGESVLQMRDGLVPVVDLGQTLGYRAESGPLDGKSLLLIEGESGNRTALAVDRVFDQREVVIKGLEQNYRQVPGIAAATILGDGKIALIVDTDQLVAPPVSAAQTSAFFEATAGVSNHV